jgi:hypothetical protein
MADYTQPNAVEKRTRYFDGQFLQDQDFVDEQKYHLDRERRLSRALRITGITEGLAVSSPAANKVMVSKGTAIDSSGRQVVLATDRTLDLPASFRSKQEVNLYIIYQEDLSLDAEDMPTTGGQSPRRWLERPKIVAVTADTPALTAASPDANFSPAWETQSAVLLAQLNLNSSGVMTVTSSVAKQVEMSVNGNVGIGSAGALSFGSNLGQRIHLYGQTFGIGVQSWTQYFRSEGNFAWYKGGTHDRGICNPGGGKVLMVIQNENVGIGTASPRGPLEVFGTQTGTGTITSSGTTVTGSGTAVFQSQLQIGDRITVSGQTRTVNAITSNTALTVDSAFAPDITPATAFTFARTALLTMNSGNVGIGMASPTSALHVATAKSVRFELGTGQKLSLGGSGSFEIDAPNVVGGRFVVTEGGNVGIGTTNPATRLTVNGDNASVNIETTEVIRLIRPVVSGVKNSNSAGFRLGAFEEGLVGRARLDIALSGNPSGTNAFGATPDVTIMSLLANGNVGIGTNNPGAKISFKEVFSGNAPDGITWSNANPKEYGIHRTEGSWAAPSYQQLRLGWLTGIILDPGGSSDKSYVDIRGNGLRVTAGNVGIGTTSAAVRLAVSGDNATVDIETSEIIRLLRPVASGVKNSNSAGLRLGSFEQGINGKTRLDIALSGAPGSANGWGAAPDITVMSLLANGNVGIGTTSPGARLEVKGGVTILEQEAWKDATLKNNWVRYHATYNPAHYFKDSQGVVHLRGMIMGGSVAWSAPAAFTLPEGYRPPYRQLHVVQSFDTVGRVDVTNTGDVIVCVGNSGWVSLDSISFRAS